MTVSPSNPVNNLYAVPDSADVLNVTKLLFAKHSPGGLKLVPGTGHNDEIRLKGQVIAHVRKDTGKTMFVKAGTYGSPGKQLTVKQNKVKDLSEILRLTVWPEYSADDMGAYLSRAAVENSHTRATAEAKRQERPATTRTTADKVLGRAKRDTPNVRQAYLQAMAELGRDVPGRVETTTSSSLAPVDLTAFANGTYTPPTATVCDRSDGVTLFMPSTTYGLHADPGTGKSMVAQVLCAQELAKDNSVLYIDYEDSPASIVPRLIELGANPAVFSDPKRFTYIHPEEHITHDVGTFVQALTAADWSLIVIDGVNKSMQLAGVKTNETEDVNRWYDDLPRVCELTGATVVTVDHTAKGSDGTTSMGSQAKGAALTGSSIHVVEDEPLVKGQRGVLHLVVHKDRASYLRMNGVPAKGNGFHFADIVIDSRKAKTIKADILPPRAARDYTDPANRNTGIPATEVGMAVAEYRPHLSGAQRAYVAGLYGFKAVAKPGAKSLGTEEIYQAWREVWPGDLDGETGRMNTELGKAVKQGAFTRRGNKYTPATKWEPSQGNAEKRAAFSAAIDHVSRLEK